jgi:DnaK suppressor protein
MFDTPCETEYMNENQLEYFREKLLVIKSDLEESIKSSSNSMKIESEVIEEVEKSARAVARDFEIQNRARNLDMVRKINQALDRISDGSYGYCQETEEPIGLKRLEANPVALFCVEVQVEIEREGKQAVSGF